MKISIIIFLNIVIYIVLYILTRLVFTLKIAMKAAKAKFEMTKYGRSLTDIICEFEERQILKSKYVTKFNMLLTGAILAVIIFATIIIVFKSIGMAMVLSIAGLLIPKIVVKMVIQKEKQKLINITVPYLINLKNHISQDNNIISAIKSTIVDKPLDKYISRFLGKISMGVNVVEAMEELKKELDISEWDKIIISLESCYKNGGKFDQVIDYQIEWISKKTILKEKEKEEAYSSVITLVLMMIMSVMLTIKYACGEVETAQIITSSFIGRAILTLSAVSYIITIYFISKIYKEE